MQTETCVHCGKAIHYRAEFGDYSHDDGWVRCYGGAPTAALPKRDTPIEAA